MNIVTIFIAGLIGILLIVFVILLLTAITFNMKAAQKYRQKVASVLEGLRLDSMLSALGIDIDRYLHSTNMVKVHNHLSQCSACNNVDECDNGLANGTLSVEHISFCNNKSQLKKLIAKQQNAV